MVTNCVCYISVSKLGWLDFGVAVQPLLFIATVISLVGQHWSDPVVQTDVKARAECGRLCTLVLALHIIRQMFLYFQFYDKLFLKKKNIFFSFNLH